MYVYIYVCIYICVYIYIIDSESHVCWPATFTLSIWSQLRKRPWNPPEKLEVHLKCWRRNRSFFASGSAHDHKATHSHDPFWITPTHWHTVVHRISRFWNYYVVTSTKIEKQFLIIAISVGITGTTSFSSFLGAITCGDSCSKTALQCQPQEASIPQTTRNGWVFIKYGGFMILKLGLPDEQWGIFPYIGLIYGRYLQFRFLKWPVIWTNVCFWQIKNTN